MLRPLALLCALWLPPLLALACRAPCPPAPPGAQEAAPAWSAATDEPAPPAASAAESAAASKPGPAPVDPNAPPPVLQEPIVQDFGSNPYSDESAEVSFKLALGLGQVRPSSRSGSWTWQRGDCGGFAVAVHDGGGGIAEGSLVVRDGAGKVRATFARKKGSIGWSSDVTCGDLTGDGKPELIASRFTTRSELLVVALLDRPEVLYEGPEAFLEKGDDGRFALHLRDRLLDDAELALPRLITPPVPRYLVLEKGHFVDRTRDEKKRVEGQRERALAAASRGGKSAGCPEVDLFCREQLAAFFAGTALLLGDEPFERLPREADRGRARAILRSLQGKRRAP